MRRALIGLLALACLAGAARGQDAGALAMVLMGERVTWTPLTLNPVAWYKGNSNALDSSGSGYNGTWSGTAAYVAGVNGAALSFNGASQVATAEITTTNKMTFCAWVNAAAASEAGYIFSFGNPAAERWLNSYWNGGSDKVEANSPFPSVGSSAVFTESSEWVHVAVVYDGDAIAWYKNSAPAGTGTWPASVTHGVRQMVIGNRPGGSSAVTYLSGGIDDLMAFDRILTTNEIAQIYQWRE